MQLKSKADAQQRADQIGSFQTELAILEQGKILSLDDSQRSALARYHNNLIKTLSTKFDIDASKREKQLSLGMKITSFLGALGLAASVFFLFYQFWGGFSTTIQAFILITAPIIGLAATAYASYKEKNAFLNTLD